MAPSWQGYKAWYKEHAEEVINYNGSYKQIEHERNRSHWKLSLAIQDGLITPPLDCPECGNPRVEARHIWMGSYFKRVFACRGCNNKYWSKHSKRFRHRNIVRNNA